MRAVALGLAAALAAAAPAAAKPPVAPQADVMTVSGRQGLPRASATAARYQLGAVTVAPAAAERAGFVATAVEPALHGAVERTLLNHDFLVQGAAAAPRLRTQWAAVDVVQDDAGATVTVKLTADTGQAGACLPYEATGRFRALARQKSGAGRRVAGVLGTVAALGMDGGTIMARQMDWAAQENRARNAFRPVLENEGVALGFSETDVIQFGAANAMRLALADLLARLNSPACALQPSDASSTGTP